MSSSDMPSPAEADIPVPIGALRRYAALAREGGYLSTASLMEGAADELRRLRASQERERRLEQAIQAILDNFDERPSLHLYPLGLIQQLRAALDTGAPDQPTVSERERRLREALQDALMVADLNLNRTKRHPRGATPTPEEILWWGVKRDKWQAALDAGAANPAPEAG